MLFAAALLAFGFQNTGLEEPWALGQTAASTAERHATEIAMSVLADGGTAVDAAVAAHFALAVTYPNAGNLGGGGFLIYRKSNGEAFFLDFREVAPANATQDMYGLAQAKASTQGWLAVGVPGAVPGMAAAHARWGNRPWSSLVTPAAELAARGFRVGERLHKRFARYEKALAQDPLTGALFAPAGKAIPAGFLLKQTQLARTLKSVAADATAMRRGAIIEALVENSRKSGGILTLEDFENYQPVLRPLHTISWHGLEILAPSAPSSGGVFLTQCLHTLERFPLALWGWADPRTIQIIGEATAAAFGIRNRWLGDPAGFDFDSADLIDLEAIRSRAKRLSPKRYTPPQKQISITADESTETTHFSIVDGYGGAVSLTTTLNGNFGAKVMAPGGFLMNNEMDDFAAQPGAPNQFGLVQGRYNAIRPGRRPLSSMSPVIVVRDGQVDAVLGSPGGPRILSSVLQVLLNRYVFGMSPFAAVAAPRMHRQDLPPELRYEEGRLRGGVASKLRQVGQPLKPLRAIGYISAVFRDYSGELQAIADPRFDGLGMVSATGEPKPRAQPDGSKLKSNLD